MFSYYDKVTGKLFPKVQEVPTTVTVNVLLEIVLSAQIELTVSFNIAVQITGLYSLEVKVSPKTL